MYRNPPVYDGLYTSKNANSSLDRNFFNFVYMTNGTGSTKGKSSSDNNCSFHI
jgi:hypothetical protein